MYINNKMAFVSSLLTAVKLSCYHCEILTLLSPPFCVTHSLIAITIHPPSPPECRQAGRLMESQRVQLFVLLIAGAVKIFRMTTLA